MRIFMKRVRQGLTEQLTARASDVIVTSGRLEGTEETEFLTTEVAEGAETFSQESRGRGESREKAEITTVCSAEERMICTLEPPFSKTPR
jgi:hypothetical protein